MWLLPFIILLITLILILFLWYFSQKDKKKRAAQLDARKKALKRSGKKPGHQEKKAPAPESRIKEVTPDDIGQSPTVVATDDKTKDIKIRIKEGIEDIFSDTTDTVTKKERPFQVDSIHPAIMKLAKEHISSLQNLGEIYKLFKVMDEPDVSMAKLSRIVVASPILAGKVLKVANSPFFGLKQKIDSISRALMIIGLTHFKNILYYESFANSFKKDENMFLLLEHMSFTSICASHIHRLFSGLDIGTLFTMGLLHDIGKFIIAKLPHILEPGAEFKKSSFVEYTIWDEDRFFGINHSVIGSLVVEEWKLSEMMVKTIQMHHCPSSRMMKTLELDENYLKHLLVIFLSNQVAKLFVSEERNRTPIEPLSNIYYEMVDKKKLLSIVLDDALFSEVKKAERLMKSYN